MTSVVLCPLYNGVALQDNNGNLLSKGQLFTYQAGSFTVPQATYTDNTGNTLNANPIILSSTGRLPHGLWLDATLNYNFVLTLSDGTTIIETTDNVSASSVTGNIVTSLTAGPGITLSSSTGNVTISTGTGGWSTGTTPLYISGTSFSVVGNQTVIYSVELRIQATVTAGTVYGTILTSSYSGITGVTTVTLQMDDSEVLDSGLSVIQYSTTSAKSTPPSSSMIVTPINVSGTYYPVMAASTTTNSQAYIIDPDGALTYNPGTDILTGNFTGNITGNTVTQSNGNNSNLIASTEFVANAITTITSGIFNPTGTWVNETASRVIGNVYINSTSYFMPVSVNARVFSTQSGTLFINGNAVVVVGATGSDTSFNLSALIPPSANYKVTASPGLGSWYEFR